MHLPRKNDRIFPALLSRSISVRVLPKRSRGTRNLKPVPTENRRGRMRINDSHAIRPSTSFPMDPGEFRAPRDYFRATKRPAQAAWSTIRGLSNETTGEYRTHDSHASDPSLSHRRVPDDSMQLALIVLPETSHKRQRITICRRIHTFVPWTHTENMILMLCIRQGAMEGSPQVRLLAVCGCSSQWLPTRDR